MALKVASYVSSSQNNLIFFPTKRSHEQFITFQCKFEKLEESYGMREDDSFPPLLGKISITLLNELQAVIFSKKEDK